MSDNKKYYYLKLKENFFDTDELRILESMPNGYLYSNLLLKLYLKSLKFEGRLRLNEFIPYNPEMIATITNINIDTVRQGLKVLNQLNLIDILPDGTIYMLEIQNFIGQSSTEADRKRSYRQKIENEKNFLLTGQKVGQSEDKCPPKVDKNPPELELELELEKDIELDNKKTLKKAPQKQKNRYAEYVLMTEGEHTKLIDKYGEHNVQLMIEKLDNYKGASGKKYKSDYRAICSWVADEIISKAKKDNFKFKNTQSTFNNFNQRDYDFKDLKNKLLGWDPEGE